MASFSKVILMGNLTRDPELRAIPSGAQVCNFDLAMNRVFTTQAGERKEEVCYMTIVVWGKQGENCAQYLKKGRQALVEGHLQKRARPVPGRRPGQPGHHGAGSGRRSACTRPRGRPVSPVPRSRSARPVGRRGTVLGKSGPAGGPVEGKKEERV